MRRLLLCFIATLVTCSCTTAQYSKFMTAIGSEAKVIETKSGLIEVRSEKVFFIAEKPDVMGGRSYQAFSIYWISDGKNDAKNFVNVCIDEAPSVKASPRIEINVDGNLLHAEGGRNSYYEHVNSYKCFVITYQNIVRMANATVGKLRTAGMETSPTIRVFGASYEDSPATKQLRDFTVKVDEVRKQMETDPKYGVDSFMLTN